MVKDRRPNLVHEWSRDKLDFLSEYLAAYRTVMSRQSWCRGVYYVDAFAGPGDWKDRDEDTERYVEGSPLRALSVDPPFDHYIFIERDEKHASHLRGIITGFPTRDVQLLCTDANEAIMRSVCPVIRRDRYVRGFVLLDPYGLTINWETMKALADTHACDIFVNFSIMGFQRRLPADRSMDESQRLLFERVMGDVSDLEGLYRKDPQMNLFGHQSVHRDRIPAQRAATLYANRLKNIFDFVSDPVIMKNTRNAPLYALFIASQNKNAAPRIAGYLSKKYERLVNV